MKVLICGATGKMGGGMVKARKGGPHELYALTRDPTSKAAEALKTEGIPLLQGDFNDPQHKSCSRDMAKLMKLPPELLLDIFQHLDNADLARCKRLCKAANEAARQIPLQRHTLKIDHVGHSVWKFFRMLLMNPTACDRLTDLRIEWHRRTEDEATWTEKWSWTTEERHLLEQLKSSTSDAKSTPTDGKFSNLRSSLNTYTYSGKKEIFKVVEDGVNSEALLPLILYFTTNLEILDLGDAQLELVVCDYYGPSYAKYNAIASLLPEEDRLNREDEYFEDDSVETFEKFEEAHIPGGFSLWFQVNIGHPGSYLPGLLNLKHLKHGMDDSVFTSEYLHGWYARYLAPLLFLPHIETIHTTRCATLGMGTHDAISTDLRRIQNIPVFTQDGGESKAKATKSSVRELIFDDARMIDLDYIYIAKVTENLTKVIISQSEESWLLDDQPSIVGAFRKNNSGLSLDNITINEKSGEEVGEIEASSPDG
ncbi:hypothetical protein H072_11068 [Dactylellina haptotyla CBS 200.50]|uniref:F-box domain-containing protein n=1 Tax=Dactylellina haptotyla (strain CBS 200.50) TaxID=1284197 RepID=S7ZXL3_DACHA|nr:hypothetical protein H072_11068 [Dactylellina haptotyla CBS 200.50]